MQVIKIVVISYMCTFLPFQNKTKINMFMFFFYCEHFFNKLYETFIFEAPQREFTMWSSDRLHNTISDRVIGGSLLWVACIGLRQQCCSLGSSLTIIHNEVWYYECNVCCNACVLDLPLYRSSVLHTEKYIYTYWQRLEVPFNLVKSWNTCTLLLSSTDAAITCIYKWMAALPPARGYVQSCMDKNFLLFPWT